MVFLYLLLFLAGLFGGFVAGLIGIGGGIIYVLVIPEALHALGVPPTEVAQYTIANSLFAIFAAAAVVNYRHIQVKFYYREIFIIGICSSIASILSLHYIVNTHHYSLFYYNLVTLVFIIFLFINTLIKINSTKQHIERSSSTPIFLLIGIVGGIISSFSGLGGGIVVIPLLCSLMKFDIKKASIISSGVIMVTSFFSTIYNIGEAPLHPLNIWHWGYIIFPISLALIFGVLLSSSYGVLWSKKLSSRSISYIYSVLLFCIIVKKSIELLGSVSN